MRILIIEDEFNLADAISSRLKKENYSVDISTDGIEGLENALTNIYDLILLDVMLPQKNGFEILKELKENHIDSKVIMITAKNELDNILNGFENGADDYLTKPFHLEELVARINVQLRKKANNNSQYLEFGDLQLDTKNNQLLCSKTKEKIEISYKEYLLIEYFIINQNQIVSRENLYDKIWGYDNNIESNNLEAYLSFIRKKIKIIGSSVKIKPVRGLGYKLEKQWGVLMKRLKNKIFIVLIAILTTFLISIIFIFNYQSYLKEYNIIKNNIDRIKNIYDELVIFNNSNFEKPLLIDQNVYIVIFDSKNNIKQIISYSTEAIDEQKIISLIDKYLNNNLKTNEIGNLYTNKYIYYLTQNNNLIVIDNSIINQKLLSLIDTSFIIFILLELIIIYTSLKLTTWITNPVKESFEKQKQFIYDASHELKTPLSVITASVEMLENNPSETKWLKNIKSESERMNNLIIQMLNLAKSENINKIQKYTLNNLSKIIEKVVLTFESIIYEKGLKIDYNIEKNINFKCDADNIKELISILLDNAIKHSYDKSKIIVNLYKEKDNIIIEIKNRGDSIPKKEREKIFERFYRIDRSRNRDENRYGLGLSIAKNIVINHQGKISVDSLHGYTTFKVVFKQILK